MDDKEQAASVRDMPALIERIENRVGMGCGAWDMVNAADLVRAVIAESSSHREAEVKALREALLDILRVHANDNHRPRAFYIAAEALKE